jgi:hypothetical protein
MSEHDPLPEPPAPSREFADRLRERLRELDARARRPPHLWAMIAAYAVAGTALLLAALGVAV